MVDSTTTTAPLERLLETYPWPQTMPDVAADPHGWLASETAEFLRQYVDPESRVVCELGSWLGCSARLLLRLAPRATLLCVDHWLGGPEHPSNPQWSQKLPTLYETFLRNLWEHRQQVIPVKADTLDGLAEIRAAGVEVQAFYVDATHTTARVFAELVAINGRWPAAVIVGDDFNNAGVAAGVRQFAEAAGRAFESNQTAFAFPGRA